jgi:hypothetical protein
MNQPKYKWDHKLSQYYELNTNPSAIYLLEQFPSLIHPYYLSINPHAIDLIKKHIKDIYLDDLSENPCAVKLLEKQPELIRWKYLSKNPNAIDLIKNNIDKISYIDLGVNPNVLDFVDFNKLSWFHLVKNPNIEHQIINGQYNLIYKNKIVKYYYFIHDKYYFDIYEYPNAIHIIENELSNHINWCLLSSNPNAIHLLERNIDKINWFNLCANPNAISILEKNVDKLNHLCWNNLCRNPNALHLICKYDYELMKKNYEMFKQELIEHVMNPIRLLQISIKYDFPFIDLVEIYG